MFSRASLLIVAAAISPLAGAQNHPKADGHPAPRATTVSMPAAPLAIRKNASTAAANADFQAFAKAMKIMRTLNCSDPTSWYYQGGMHWVPDSFPTVNPLCASYQTTQDLKLAWDNCTHRGGTELHFLIWHRLYIYYFEEIIRSVSGKADFALPYWDYCDANYRVMPQPFRDAGSSLFEAGRFAPLNQGQPIEKGMDAALSLTKLMQNTSYAQFNTVIDGAPHGAMHSYIGGGLTGAQVWNQIFQKKTDGLMARVPSAGFDPIFWSHHSNIDYIWEQWMQSNNGAMPDLAQLKASPIPYQFFDPKGKLISLTVEQAFEKAFTLPVTYDTLYQPVLALADDQPQMLGLLTQEFVIEKPKTTLSLALAVPEKAAGLLRSDTPGRAILHVVVAMKEEPAGLFELYVRNDGDKAIDHPDRLAGVMTFFGAAHHAGHSSGGAHGDMQGAMKGLTKEFRFDITDELDLLGYDGKLDVHIVRQGGSNEASKITVKEINIESR